ncbi:MAG: glycoside hydrolase family 3 N-terminal domain-containing protein [Ignavibacteria bacterium]|nr:glycoside hydrolase family 3 N-terminal domain-containing protein [Ignavibacteria bacterium]
MKPLLQKNKFHPAILVVTATLIFLAITSFTVTRHFFSKGISTDSLYKINDVSLFSVQDDWVEETISKMTLEEKVGQIIFPAVVGKFYNEDDTVYKRIIHYVNDLKVGGFIVYQYAEGSEVYAQTFLLNKLQQISKYPLLIGADYENGVSFRTNGGTIFPSNMALGAANDEALTHQMGEIIAEESRQTGVHYNFAPVVDINNNPLNPIINVRAFGENPSTVTKLSNAIVTGMQHNHLLSTAKHFPGHGNTSTDSHKDLPVIGSSKEELFQFELQPFIREIKNGVMSIMVGHLAVPAFDDDTIPATLSKKIVTGLLKEQLGFKGLIVTDALNMKAISNSFTPSEAAVQAFNAGCDILLFPSNADEVDSAIVQAVHAGIITEERLDESVRKILLAKRWAGLTEKRTVSLDDLSTTLKNSEHQTVAKTLAEEAITLVKDEKHLIPISSIGKKKILLITLVDERHSANSEFFSSLLEKQLKNVSSVTLTNKGTKREFNHGMKEAQKANVILLSTYTRIRLNSGKIGLSDEQIKFVSQLIKFKKPIVWMSHGSPYVLGSFPEIKTFLCNYGDSEILEEAMAKAVCSKISIGGKLPVTIPNTIFKEGDGIDLRQSSLTEANQNGKSFTSVDNIIEKAIHDTVFPCAVLLIAQDGKVLHKKAFGHFTYEQTSPPMQTNTIFDLASVTKVIATTTATMICYDRGLFKLDDKVAKYLPKFAANGKQNVTIRNLLLHNSGFPPFIRFFLTCKTSDEVIEQIYNTKLDYEPGTETVYSDLGIITLGKIIEKVTKKSLDKFCTDEIFTPLEMTETFFNPMKEFISRCAPTENDDYWRHRQLVGEVHDEASAMLGGVAGHAGLFSTADDLSKLLQMLLQKGTYQGKQFIKSSTIELFIKQQAKNSTRGLGWDTKDGEGFSSAGNLFSNLSYGHTGYTGTSVWTDPTRKLFVILLTNRVYPTRENTKIIRLRPVIHDAVIKVLDK